MGSPTLFQFFCLLTFFFVSFKSAQMKDIASPCHTFIISNCDINAAQCFVEEIAKVSDPSLCSNFCQANKSCQSWIHHRRSELCELIDCPIRDWTRTRFCLEFGGPMQPENSDCPALDSGCDAYRTSDCPLASPLGSYITSVKSLETCQLMCQIATGSGNRCTHYHYNEYGCRLFDHNRTVDCDGIIGPSDPIMDECMDSPSSTTTTSTTTPELSTTTLQQIQVVIASKNAVTGRLLPEVTVIYLVTTPEGGFFNGTGVTDSQDGFLDIGMVSIGSVIEAEATKDGYLKSTTNMIVTSDDPMNMAMSLNPDDGSNRIVLTWGAFPKDLDLHLVEYVSTDNLYDVCHVYWGDKFCDAHEGTHLDTDNLNGGPETITVNEPGMDDLFMIFVQKYKTNSTGPLYASDAQLELYMNATGSYSRIEIPAEGKPDDSFWFVGCFKGNDGLLDDFAIVNELSSLNPYEHNKTTCLELLP